MEAGRELDALIAEKVMGIEPLLEFPKDKCPICFTQVPDSYMANIIQGQDDWDTRRKCRLGHEFKLTPQYSYDIKRAFEVVETLREEKRTPITIAHLWDAHERKWEYLAKAEFEGESRIEFATSTNVAHAICLVALKVIGVKV